MAIKLWIEKRLRTRRSEDSVKALQKLATEEKIAASERAMQIMNELRANNRLFDRRVEA